MNAKDHAAEQAKRPIDERPAPHLSWTQPICDECFADRHPAREPTRLTPDVRERETCCFCEATTVSGIYYRVDPASVKYPTLTKD